MRVLILSAISILFLSGCASGIDLIETKSTPVEREPLDLAPAEPLELSDPRFIVVTPDNADEVFDALREEGSDPVIIGMTDNGYEKLSVDFARIRQHINTQRNILLRYKEYYEDSSSPPESSDQ